MQRSILQVKLFKATIGMKSSHFSYRMEAIMKHAREIAQVLHAKTLGTEHVLLSF